MLSFVNDYSEGAHPQILKRLLELGLEKNPGYGMDSYSQSAKEKIRKACGKPKAEVFFLAGGTQTNQVVIDTMTEAYEGVVSAVTGHVNCHEAGAIEFTGHKVMSLPQQEGKIQVQDLKELLKNFYGDENHEHMVFPGIVYLTHPTEYGTLYSKQELSDIHAVCRQYQIPLYLDGARLGYGLAARGTDVTLKDIAEHTDVFYIGGTKVGALFGEALVFPEKETMPGHFVTRIKQHGALLAKGFVTGLQFDTLFTDDLYARMSENAIVQAETVKEALTRKGYRFFLQSPTNQIFIVMEKDKLQELGKQVAYSFWEKLDEEHTVIRLATSWATTDEDVQALIRIL